MSVPDIWFWWMKLLLIFHKMNGIARHHAQNMLYGILPENVLHAKLHTME